MEKCIQVLASQRKTHRECIEELSENDFIKDHAISGGCGWRIKKGGNVGPNKESKAT